MIRALVFVSPACGAAAFASPAAQQTAVTGLQRSVSSAPLASAAGDSAPQASTPWTSCILAGLGLGYAAAAASRVTAQRRAQRGSAAQRKFFGGASPPKQPETYKDFSDPWMQGADLGFDPLNLAVGGGVFDTAASAVPETTYYNYRESEVKHGRFAMTAFLAIFFEDADRGAVLSQLGVAGAQDRLDGTLGLDEVQGPVLALALAVQAFAEYNLQRSEGDGNFLSVEANFSRCPGDLGFDPLSLQKSDSNKKNLHNVEVNTGRLAMIGVTSFLVREFALKSA